MRSVFFNVVTAIVLAVFVTFGLNCAASTAGSGHTTDLNQAVIYFVSAQNNVRIGNYQQAIEDATVAIELFPLTENRLLARIYYIRAESYNKLGNNEEAVLDYEKAVSHSTKDEAPSALDYNQRAWIYAYHLKRDFDQAIKDATKAIELEPEKAAYYDTRGWAYLGSGDSTRAMRDFDQAIKYATNAIELKPEYGEAGYYGTRGWAYLGRGDYTHAMDDFSKALQLDPSSENPREGLRKIQELQATTPPSAPDLDDF
jgi:tetratricopeptide (TPR) repeat protein